MGSSRDDDHGLDSGPVYIYERDIDSANGWREVKKLISIGSRWPDRFGFFLTISGNALAIGAPRYGSGSVYIFERNWNDIPNSWKQVGYLGAQNHVEDGFGGSPQIFRARHGPIPASSMRVWTPRKPLRSSQSWLTGISL